MSSNPTTSEAAASQRKMNNHLAFMSNMFPEDPSPKQAASNSTKSAETSTTFFSTSTAERPTHPQSTRILMKGGKVSMSAIPESSKESAAGPVANQRLNERKTLTTINPDPSPRTAFQGLMLEDVDDAMDTSMAKKNSRRATIDLPRSGRRSQFFRNNTSGSSRSRSRGRFSSPFRRRSVDGNHDEKRSTTGNSSSTVVSMDEYARNGSRVKSLLGSAFQHVKHASRGDQQKQQSRKDKNKRRRGNHEEADDDDNGTSVSAPVAIQIQPTEEQSRVVRDQTTEIWRLKRELEQIQQEHQSLESKHMSLRRDLENSQVQALRARDAAKIASNNARQARSDAEAAETTATHMAQQLNDLQTVVDETKKASQLLQNEHIQVEKKVARAETALHHKALELSRLREKMHQHAAQQELFEATKHTWHRQQEKSLEELNEATKLVKSLERQHHEQHALATDRKKRLDTSEANNQEMNILLQELSQAKLETEHKVQELSDTVQHLTSENRELHEKLNVVVAESHQTNRAQQDALNKAEQHSLQLRIEKETLEEEVQRLQTNPSDRSHYVIQSAISLPPKIPKKAPSLDGDKAPIDKENGTNSGSSSCSICLKVGFGSMKRCQCGSSTCQKRAHLTCANRVLLQKTPSVSHPGTAAPRLPLVLCQTALRSLRSEKPLQPSTKV